MLVIVTGGTITMVNTPDGYVSVTGLGERLKLNVALYDSEHAKDINLDP